MHIHCTYSNSTISNPTLQADGHVIRPNSFLTRIECRFRPDQSNRSSEVLTTSYIQPQRPPIEGYKERRVNRLDLVLSRNYIGRKEAELGLDANNT